MDYPDFWNSGFRGFSTFKDYPEKFVIVKIFWEFWNSIGIFRDYPEKSMFEIVRIF